MANRKLVYLSEDMHTRLKEYAQINGCKSLDKALRHIFARIEDLKYQIPDPQNSFGVKLDRTANRLLEYIETVCEDPDNIKDPKIIDIVMKYSKDIVKMKSDKDTIDQALND